MKILIIRLDAPSIRCPTGIDHLLYGDNASEAKMACFMGLLSQLAAKPQVLRVSPFYSAERLGAVASAIVQSATITGTPLHDAGLDGTGEVIQVEIASVRKKKSRQFF